MPKYNITVPRARGIQPSSCDVAAPSVCTRDMILHVLLGRFAEENGETWELETVFNPSVNAIDIDIPEDILQSIETVGVGINLQRYMDWVHPVANGASSNVLLGTSDQLLSAPDQIGQLHTPNALTNLVRSVFVEGDGGPVELISDPQILPGVDGQFVTVIGVSDANTITLVNGAGMHLHGNAILGAHDTITLMYHEEDDEWVEVGRNNPESEKVWAFSSPAGVTGIFYSGGFYDFASTHNNFGGAPTFGDATRSTAAHFFVVLGEVVVDDLTLRVTGDSITDNAVGVAGDTQDIVIPSGTLIDSYFETSKKWNGEITISVVSGTAKNCNYGWCKYWDNNNTSFRVIGLESTWIGGSTDASPNLILRHHRDTGWIYNAGSEPTPPPGIADMNIDHGVNIRVVNSEPGAWKRSNLNTVVDGSGSEGTIIECTTNQQLAFQNANFMVRIRPA